MTAEEDRALQVVRRHLAAVGSGEPAAMACDYAEDATIQRAGGTHVGRRAIEQYFSLVPARLEGGHVSFGDVCHDGDAVVFSWRIVGGPADGTSGTDRCTVADGLITHQIVSLDGDDF